MILNMLIICLSVVHKHNVKHLNSELWFEEFWEIANMYSIGFVLILNSMMRLVKCVFISCLNFY